MSSLASGGDLLGRDGSRVSESRRLSQVAGSEVDLLWAPYDSGHRGTRMGAGPEALIEAGAAERLRASGHWVRERELEPTSSWTAELQTAFELYREIATLATAALAGGRVPLLLSGNCGATIGMLAALQASQPATAPRRVGLVWLDAHGDFNTPDIDPSGFLDGQGLAMAVGRCWQTLTATVPGFTPLPEQRALLLGARALDQAEETALLASQVSWLPPASVREPGAVQTAVEQLKTDVDFVHVHVDLDVHDPSIAPANSYAAPDGLTAAQVHDAIYQVAEHLPIASATLASYDPTYDRANRMRDTALDLLILLATLAS
jgi:arginase